MLNKKGPINLYRDSNNLVDIWDAVNIYKNYDILLLEMYI